MPPHRSVSDDHALASRGRSSSTSRALGRASATGMLVAVMLISGCSSGAASSVEGIGAPVTVPDVAGCESLAADGAAGGMDGLPALRLPCLVGGQVASLDDLGGRPVLVNLWASWCAPCREEMPLLQSAYERYGDRIGFLGVITEDTRSSSASLITDLGVTYAHVVDEDKALLTELAAPGLPVTLAVAADGRVIDRQIGQMSAARLEELLTALAADVAGTP